MIYVYATIQDKGRQGNHDYDDREEHEGHWVGSCLGHFSMTVKPAGKIG